jgi:hypothetical protein
MFVGVLINDRRVAKLTPPGHADASPSQAATSSAQP